jgi:hypothetical protein
MNLNVSLRQINQLPEALCQTRKSLPHVLPIAEYELIIQQGNTSAVLPQVTFAMIKWGNKYSALYVNTLIHSLLRFTSSLSDQYLITIVCFTDDISDSNLTHEGPVQYRFELVDFFAFSFDPRPLPETLFSKGWSGWWYKAFLFSQEAELSGTVIYFDLDTVVCSSTFTQLFTQLSSPAILSTTLTQSETSSPSVAPISTPTNSFYFACLGAHTLTNEGISPFP